MGLLIWFFVLVELVLVVRTSLVPPAVLVVGWAEVVGKAG